MPLPSPNLNDRSYNQLLAESLETIKQTCPEWTDRTPSDPGIVLLELFAHLTGTMIYRLNRLPQKVYIELLRLIGVTIQPPSAAAVTLQFSRANPAITGIPVEIPRGTRVTLGRSANGSKEPPVFATAQTITIAAGESEANVLAYHCDQIEAELAGMGSGLAGQSVTVKRPPVIAPTGDGLDLIVGVEAQPGELGERVPAIKYNGKTYRLWRENESFTDLGPDPFVYIVDRNAGIITFAPAAQVAQPDGTLAATAQPLAAVPAAGREIRVWYRSGGGPEGNVAPNTITTLKDTITGVLVTNPDAATGGRAAETLDNALIRGPQQMRALQRAVTARDYELVALNSSRAIARARALTRASLWSFATPGTVEVLLVPYLPEDQRGAGQVSIESLTEHETEEARSQIQQALDERRPLGTTCLVNWARYKIVSVTARIVVRREEDQAAIRQRVTNRLYETITPLPARYSATGWPFGQALRASNVYEISLAEPGIRWIDTVRLMVDEVPEKNVSALAADPFKSQTWYAGSDSVLFRSLNDGDGWESAGRFPDEHIDVVSVHPDRAGLLAIATSLPNNAGSRVHISADSGETWEAGTFTTAFQVEDIAWMLRDNKPVLLLATNVGLYEILLQPGASPVQLLVDQANQNRGFYAVATSTDVRGAVSVAVASQDNGGIYMSSQGGRPGTYRKIGLQGEDIRILAVQHDGPRSFLWAGAYTPGGDNPGRGCFRWELRGTEDPPEGWVPFGNGWTGGSCRALAFLDTKVFAASYRAGVLRLDLNTPNAAWQACDVNSGLPLRDRTSFYPVVTMASDPGRNTILAGGGSGVYRSTDGGTKYSSASNKVFLEKVTLPDTWLFVSGKHEITVVSEDEANRD